MNTSNNDYWVRLRTAAAAALTAAAWMEAGGGSAPISRTMAPDTGARASAPTPTLSPLHRRDF